MKPEVHYIIPAANMRTGNHLQRAAKIYESQQTPEAAAIMDLDELTNSVISRDDIDVWQKADLLNGNLQRFLALKESTETIPAQSKPLLKTPLGKMKAQRTPRQTSPK